LSLVFYLNVYQMQIIKKNLYKQTRTFRCVHDVHRHFNSEMSPFYILSEKHCYPDGCVYFHWKCRLLAKQKTCFRGFSHVGNKCFNCKFFYEEKRHQYPELITNNDEKGSFLDRFTEFEDWILELKSRRVACEGKIAGITPHLSLRRNGNQQNLSAHGFLIRFEEGYIDNLLFEDPFYLSISSLSQNKLLLREGDNLEFEAGLIIDRGRLKFIKAGRFQFYERGIEKPIRQNDVIVALKTFTIQENQPSNCMGCANGILVDVEKSKNGSSRVMVCLQGIADYRYCSIMIKIPDSKNGDSCVNSTWNGKKCHHVL